MTTKTVFTIASFDEDGKLTLLPYEFTSYEDAENEIINTLIEGMYHVQKVFVKS